MTVVGGWVEGGSGDCCSCNLGSCISYRYLTIVHTLCLLLVVLVATLAWRCMGIFAAVLILGLVLCLNLALLRFGHA